jgi:hypothetical protein
MSSASKHRQTVGPETNKKAAHCSGFSVGAG